MTIANAGTLAGIVLLLGAAAASAETTAIVGATVHTAGPQGSIDNATVLIQDGRIASVGASVSVPDDATVIEAAGKVVTPGLFTPSGYIGLVEVGNSAGPLDAIQRGSDFTASFAVADAFNPRSTLVAVNRIEGVTRALIMPAAAGPDPANGTSHVFSGLAAVANLGGGADGIDRRDAAMVVNLGENGAALAGESRASALLVLQRALDEARDYRDHRDAYERGQHSDYHHSVQDLQALQPVLTGRLPLLVHVDRAADIAALLGMADAYGFRLVISGGVEAWLMADELAARRVAVVLAPEANLPSNFDRINANERNAAVLVGAGVKVAFADGSATTHNARNITQSAGNAVVQGLTPAQALQAITLAPAEIFGVADRVGSIEQGKDADLVIWPGDPLELTNYPESVFIRGVAVEMQSRQTLLRDRYRDPADSRPPAYRRSSAR